MKHLISLFFAFLLINACSTIEKNHSISMFVGTYTDGESEGIYRFSFNEKTGELTDPVLVAKQDNPSFLTLSPNKKYLYAVSETNNFDNEQSGSVTSYKIDDNGSWKPTGTVSSEGAHPCHIALNESGSKAVVSNYTGGNLAIYNINNGVLAKASQVFDHKVDSVKSHVHSAQFHGENLYVADLGRNILAHYNETNGEFALKSESTAELPLEMGPRHFALSHSGTFIHIINEYGNTVSSLKKSGASFDLIQNPSTLADDYSGDSYCADIHLSSDEKFLYGSNRGENSIVVFKRDIGTGELTKIQNISVEGDWPRNFTISPDGNFLLVANQKSQNISVFTVDKSSGMLSFKYSKDFPTPVCLVF